MYLNIKEMDFVEDARATLEENFLKIAEAKPQYPTLRIFRSDGRGIVNITDKRATHKYPDPAITPWFKSALGLLEGDSHVSGFHMCPEHNLPSLFVSQPYYYRGRLNAIGVLHLHLQEFMGKILKDIEIGKSGSAYVINDQGTIVAHKHSSMVGIDLSQLVSIQSVILGNKGTLVERDEPDGIFLQKSYLPLKIKGSGVVVAQPLAEAIAVSTSVKWYIAGITSIVTGFLLLLIFLTSRKIVIRPVKELSAATKKLVMGDLTARVNSGKKLRCWDIQQCGISDCPAYGDELRSCWHVAGTHCPTCSEGEYSQKIESCQECKVYHKASGDEIQELAQNFNLMAFSLNEYITGLEETEKRLREQKQLFQTILDATPDFVSLQDRQLVYLSVNKAFCTVVGRKEAEIIGKTNYDIFSRVQADTYRQEDLSILETGNPVVKENEINGSTGKKWLHVFKLPVYGADGKMTGLLCSGRDITELKQVQEQLTRAQKMESIGQLVAGIAHEINTPLGIILGYVQLLLEEMNPGSQNHEDLMMVEKQTQICRTIVSDLLRFSRHTQSTMGPVNINSMIEEVLSVVEHTFKLEQVFLARHFEPNIPQIVGDKEKLKQAVINLVNNAFDAIKSAGSITITTRYDVRRNAAIIGVCDTGCGIAPENIDQVFDPFYTTKPVGKGTGLGLSVTFGIIREHGGKIEIESPPVSVKNENRLSDLGTAFIIHLPVSNDYKKKELKDGQDTRTG
jgi:PAS domain S-box-containing protein